MALDYTKDEIYFDHSATTRVDEDAAKLAYEIMTENYGNPSSLHHRGFLASQALQKARKQVASALYADVSQIFFTSGGTEANNLALLGAAQAYKRRGNKILVSSTEHSSVISCAQQLQNLGFEVQFIAPQKDGSLSPRDFEDAADEKTILVSCMSVNSEVGAQNDVAAISAAVKRKNKNILMHCDHVQGFGKISMRPQKMGIDLMSISAHKIYAPKGAGALYIGKGTRVLPQHFGGEQENALRPGTENMPAICAFGLCAEKMQAQRTVLFEHYRSLNEKLRSALSCMDGIALNSSENAVPYILNFSALKIRSEILLHFLQEKGISVSSGSACAKGAPSHVLQAMGLPKERVDSAIRVSFGKENTLEQVDAFLAALQQGLQTIQKLR